MRSSRDVGKLIKRAGDVNEDGYRSYRDCAMVVRGVQRLGKCLDWLGADRVLFVADPFVIKSHEFAVMIRQQLSNTTHRIFSQFSPYPTLPEIKAGLAMLQSFDAKLIVAVGGGSAIDMGKLISVAAGDPDRVDQTLAQREPIRHVGPAVVAIPTTAGTGAEVTHFSALYLDTGKVSIAHPRMRPIVSVLDPHLTATMPPTLTAATGLDAVCQAVESLWSVRSNKQSRAYATRALRLGLKYLPIAVKQQTFASRRAMSNAAYLAGRAIDLTTTTACHAMSYVLTQEHHIPHGHAVALTIPSVLRLNADINDENCTDKRGPEHTREAINLIVRTMRAVDVEDAAVKFERFMDNLGCDRCLGQFNVKASDVDRLVASVDVQRLSNNPRRLNESTIDRIYRSLLEPTGRSAVVAS